MPLPERSRDKQRPLLCSAARQQHTDCIAICRGACCWCWCAASAEDGQLYFLRKETAECRTLISKLENKIENALSYREKASKLLEEAHRALGRLEQVGSSWA